MATKSNQSPGCVVRERNLTFFCFFFLCSALLMEHNFPEICELLPQFSRPGFHFSSWSFSSRFSLLRL